jgi:catechol 2,3-dioxygenase-like lactoylglutathione lyase family enzyme
VLHVKDVEASLHFYVHRLGFTSPWRYDEDGKVYVAQVERQGCALILADTWPVKIGKGLMFISLNVEPAARELELVRIEGALKRAADWRTTFLPATKSTK